jgi:RNA polymerase-associated protein CTR9
MDTAGRIAVLSSLAAHWTTLADMETDQDLKRHLYDRAAEAFKRADAADDQDTVSWIGKAHLLFKRGKMQEAGEGLKNLLKDRSNNRWTRPEIVVVAHLLRGCVQFHLGSYVDSLRSYREAIATNPDLPGATRLGPAMCYFELGQLDEARLAFKRVLELDPANVDAHMGLAVLGLTDAVSLAKDLEAREAQGAEVDPAEVARLEALRRESLEALKGAYSEDPTKASVLNTFARQLIEKGDYERVSRLAKLSFQNTAVKKIRAESTYLIARAYHAEGKLAEAMSAYQEAEKFWAEMPLLCFPMGQLHMQAGQYAEAVGCFEKHLAQDPECAYTIKALGAAHQLLGDPARAQVYLKRALEVDPLDKDVRIDLARLLEVENPKAADAHLAAVLKSMTALGEPIPPELWNNAGVLRHKLGDLAGAEKAYARALPAGALEELLAGTRQVAELEVTTVYNLARLCEDSHAAPKAERLYRAIVAAVPGYADAHLRLSLMAMEQGGLNEATRLVKEALAAQPANSDALAVYGGIAVAREDWKKAAAKFRLMPDGEDDYGQVALGNVYLAQAAKAPTAAESGAYLDKAFEVFKAVLRKNPRSIYAANGIGCILAEKGHAEEANRIFSQVREATSSAEDAWLNLAHTAVVVGNHSFAAKSYLKAHKTFHPGAPDRPTLTYLARAHFENGMVRSCIDSLKLALQAEPDNLTTWYNLAVAYIEPAKQLIKKQITAPLQELIQVKRDLEEAGKLFKALAALPEEATRGFFHLPTAQKNREVASKSLKAISEAVRAAEKAAAFEEAKRQEVARANEERRRAARLEQERAQEQAERQREELRRRAEMLAESERAAQESLAREEAARAAAAEQESKAKEGKKKKGKKRKGADEGADEGDNDDNNNNNDDDNAAALAPVAAASSTSTSQPRGADLPVFDAGADDDDDAPLIPNIATIASAPEAEAAEDGAQAQPQAKKRRINDDDDE